MNIRKSIAARVAARIERKRGELKLAEIDRKGRPAERQDELAERLHRHELAKLEASFKDDTEDGRRAKRRAERDKNRNRRRASRKAFMDRVGASILGLIGWLSTRWLAVRAWIADRIVVLPVVVAGSSALYGQFGYLHDPTTPAFDGDRTGMGWAAPVALMAGLAVEVMAFVLFRARKLGLDAGDDVRVETATGWGIVSGAVWFNWTHVDPLAGFLSAIGPIAWEVRERRERRNREIAKGTRGIAPIPLPRLGLRFRRHYRDQADAIVRTALWERVRRSYPGLVAQIENQADASELTTNLNRLANLVEANPVRSLDAIVFGPGSADVSSHGVLAIGPGSSEPGSTATPTAATEPGSPTGPGSTPATAPTSTEPGSTGPGPRTGSGTANPVRPDQVQIILTGTDADATARSASNPVWTASQVAARFATTRPGSEPGPDNATTEPGSTEPGSATTAQTATGPGSVPAVTEPGSSVAAVTTEPGSSTTAVSVTATEPGPAITTEPGSSEPGSTDAAAVTSNPVESELERTRPMPRIVRNAEPGSDDSAVNPVPNLDDRRAEDARKAQECVDLCIELLEKRKRWVGREDQLAYLRTEHGKSLNNRVRTLWWAQMQEYRELVKATHTG